jgi:hypothetical protein
MGKEILMIRVVTLVLLGVFAFTMVGCRAEGEIRDTAQVSLGQ